MNALGIFLLSVVFVVADRIVAGTFPGRKYLSGNNYWEPFAKPYFENSTKREVTTTVGQTAYLHCRVRNLGDRAVSPMEIGKLRNLTNLYLIGNQLSTLPEEMGQLKCLKVLDLSQNYFQHLPASIGDLRQLHNLLLTYNQLETLPPELKRLKKLVFLELSGNRLRCLPSEIILGLEALEELAVDRNPITSLPRNITQLKHLHYLSACKCNLKFLPGLPFHPLVNGSQRGRTKLGTSTSINNFQFLFDGNPKLNYIPYWILQLLGPNIDSFGCAIETEEIIPPSLGAGSSRKSCSSSNSQQWEKFQDSHSPKIQLNFKGKYCSLHFDEDLCKLGQATTITPTSSTTKETNSLLELCLRHVYNHRDFHGSLWTVKRPTSHIRHSISPSSSSQSYDNIQYSAFGSIGPGRHEISGEKEKQQCNEDLLQSHRPPLSEEPMEVEEDQNLLPPNLTRLLINGPMARCFECLQPIFMETWPLIFRLPTPPEDHQEQIIVEPQGDINRKSEGGIHIGCAYFCRPDCIEKFRKLTKFSSNFAFHDLRFIVENEFSWVLMDEKK